MTEPNPIYEPFIIEHQTNRESKKSQSFLNCIMKILSIILVACLIVLLCAFGWIELNRLKQNYQLIAPVSQKHPNDLNCGLDWVQYKDEKCYKILDKMFQTFDEAVKSCANLETGLVTATLPTIHTKVEQNFLSNYLFNTSRKMESFWIGAKYLTEDSKFYWSDNTELFYSNWAEKGSKGRENYCVQMQFDEDQAGKWIGESCGEKNLVVCQKLQSWSMARLQKTLLETQKELRDSLDAANKKINKHRDEIDENHKDDELSKSYCDGTGWVGYKDEKCFKLFNKPLTREEAKRVCEQEGSQLASIKSSDEQEYLTKHFFDTSSVVVNIWIGAKRMNENEFAWDDDAKFDFTNWVDGSDPSGDVKRNCAVMQSELSTKLFNQTEQIKGKWKDVSCEQWNLVVCEKLQKWSTIKFQQTLLGTRKGLRDCEEQAITELNVTKKQLYLTQNQLSATQNNLSQVKARLDSAEIQLENLIRNSVPIGFIYVQLPNEKSPAEIWPSMNWTDASATYAGVFFRVTGGDAAAFGQVQQDNAPRLDEVILTDDNGRTAKSAHNWNMSISIPITGWSDAIFTGGNAGDQCWSKFKLSAGEVRPRNMAIRIWKRIN